MKVREGPLFSYFGAKWRAVPRYPSPIFGRVIEPFAGSACYALRHRCEDVILCDADPNIRSVWRWIIGAPESEILGLPDLPAGATVRSMGLAPGPSALIGWYMNSGAAAPCQTESAGKLRQKGANRWGDKARERTAMIARIVRKWTVLDDYRDAPTDRDATWFVDPPYQGAGIHYRVGSKTLDFGALGAWCRSLPGQVIVCENFGASWLPFVPIGEVKAGPSKGRDATSHEAVYLQGPQTADPVGSRGF